MNTFETLSKVNVNGKTEKKGKFTYLSWAFAWGELKKLYPEATTKVYHNELNGMPYFGSSAGVMVKVGVTINNIEHINYLPAMDFRNNAIKIEDVNMMDINKAIQRCTVKAIALHGLGLYIYAGEDLPEEQQIDGVKLLNGCSTLKELQTAYSSLSKSDINNEVTALKDKLKLTLK